MTFNMPNHLTDKKTSTNNSFMSNFDTLSSIQTTFRTASIQSITIVMLTKRQHSAGSSDTVFCFDLFSTDTVYIFESFAFVCDATEAINGKKIARKLLLLRGREIDRCEALPRIHSYITDV